MDASALLAYCLTLIALTAAPGPLVAVLAARSANRDRVGAWAFAAGICAGDIAVIVAIALGFGIWLQSRPEIFLAARYFGGAYLLWLAARMWIDAGAVRANRPTRSNSCACLLAGFAACLSSPQTIVLYLALLPKVIAPADIGAQEIAILITATCVALMIVFLMVIALAHYARQLLCSSSASTATGRVMASCVALASIWVMLD